MAHGKRTEFMESVSRIKAHLKCYAHDAFSNVFPETSVGIDEESLSSNCYLNRTHADHTLAEKHETVVFIRVGDVPVINRP